MGQNFSHLTWTQRLQLESYLKAKLPVKEIVNFSEYTIPLYIGKLSVASTNV